MRQLSFVLGMAVVILLACVGIASAQTGHQSVFNDRDECSEALQTGNYKVYQSVYRNHRARAYGGRNFFLPKAQCVKMDVAGGVGANAKYVVQDTTISLTEKNGLLYRTDCGNRIYEIVPLPNPEPVAKPSPSPSPSPEAPRCKNRKLTYEQAKEAGLEVTADGQCNQPIAKEPKCGDNQNITIKEAQDQGLIITPDGRCVEPAPAKCANIDMTIDDARQAGYKVDKDGKCRKGMSTLAKVGIWSAIACGGGIGISAIITKDFHPFCGIPLGKKKITPEKALPNTGSPGPIRPQHPRFAEGSGTASAPTQRVEAEKPGYIWVTLGDGKRYQIRKN